MLVAGFGLHNVWVCAAMYSNAVLGGGTSFPSVFGEGISLRYLASVAVVSIVSFLVAGFDRRCTRYARSRRAMGAAAALTCVGTLLALLPLKGAAASVIDVLAGAVTGVGSTVLLLYWGVTFSRQHESAIMLAGPVAVAAGYAFDILVVQSLPKPVGGLLVAAIPFVEFALLNAVSPSAESAAGPVFNEFDDRRTRFGANLFESMLFAGLALGLLKQASLQSAFEHAAGPATVVVLLMAGGIAVVLFMLLGYIQKQGTWERFFRLIVPFTVCGVLAAALCVSEYDIFADLFLVLAYFLCEAHLWTYASSLAHRFRISPLFVFGLTRGAVTLSMFAGTVIAARLSSMFDELPFEGLAFVPVALVLVLLTRATLPRESDLMRLALRCPGMRLAVFRLDELYPAVPAAGDGSDAGTAGCTGQGGVAALGWAQPAAGAQTSVSLPPATDGDAGDGRPSEGFFSRRVKKVARTYLLTDRETDILFELAKGHGIPYIQEKYYISAGTAKTHIRNIYRKLDVHKRGDLLALIESAEDDSVDCSRPR